MKKVKKTRWTKKAQVGDVIMSDEFVEGEKDSDGKIAVGRKDSFRSKDSSKKDRAKAMYVVERTGFEGGGTGMGPHDVYPDGWHVDARRLNKDGSYNPKGELIEFYQSGCFNCMVEKVKVVGKMEKRFV